MIRCASHPFLAQQFDNIQVGTGVISHKLYSQRTRQTDPEIAPESHPTTLYTGPAKRQMLSKCRSREFFEFRVCSFAQAHTFRLKRRSVSSRSDHARRLRER